MLVFLVFLVLPVFSRVSDDPCIWDWGKCGGQNWTQPTTCCNTRFYCNETDEYYSECVPKPLVPFPPAPTSNWCGVNGTTLNSKLLQNQGEVTSLEIAKIWSAATLGLTSGHADGGSKTCIEAVTIALGECGHPAQSNWMTINDPVCSFEASGPGGIWQITSQDSDDSLLAGCSNGYDPCCDGRLAYAHAYNQGGATIIPDDYCEHQSDCTQIYSNPGGKTGSPWNDPSVDKTKPGAKIIDCDLNINNWYPDGGASLAMVTIDQSPCYFGPFSVAAGGVGREFFPGFYGWGGWFQHYTDSKAGMCDPSPQAVSLCNSTQGEWAKYPTYSQLAVEACQAMNKV